MFKYLFCLLLIIVVVPVRSANLENCTTPHNEAGQCVPVKLCSIFYDNLQNTKIKLTEAFYQYLNKSLCGFIKFESYICCAARHLTENADVSSMIFQPVRNTEKPFILPSIDPVNPTGGPSEKPFILPSINPVKPISVTDSRADHPNINLIEMNRCGIVNEERISNGNKTDLNEYPWMALLQYQTPSGFEFKCGGSLITKRYVLTAAHCVQVADKLVSVRLGEHDIDTDKDCDEKEGYCAPPVQDIGIEEIIPHVKYQRRNFKNDIALIRLIKEANIQQENVKIICLPVSTKFERIEQMTAIVSGWGYTEERNNLSNELLQAEVPLLPISVCQNFYKSRITLSNSQICGGGQNYVDTCYGDSGGPLFTAATIQEKHKIPLYYQIGVVSAGYTKCGEMNSYTVFTSVTFYVDWILDNLKP